MNEKEYDLKAQELDNEATEFIKRQVKSLIVAKGYTMERLANELNEKYYTKASKTTLSNKLARGSLRYMDMIRIADILGCTIDIR